MHPELEVLIAVVGAGPAGMSAALWLKKLGFAPWLIERKAEVGGLQRLNFLTNEWVLGHRDVTGPQLAQSYFEHIRKENIPIATCASVTEMTPSPKGCFQVTVESSVEQKAFSKIVSGIVVATGTRYRATEVLSAVAGIEKIQNRISYGPYAFADSWNSKPGETVLIVGGGDNAFENAKLLLTAGARVVMVCRSEPKAQRELGAFVDSYCRTGSAIVLHNAQLRSVSAADEIVADVSRGGEIKRFRVDRINVLAGYEPEVGTVEALLSRSGNRMACDSSGYLIVDAWGRTSVSGVYAAGDVCNPDFPNVVSAVASGASAAKAIEMDMRQTC